VNGIKLYSAAVVVALVPAVVGLVDNRSFSESVPVRIPERVSSTPDTPEPVPSSRTIEAEPTPKAQDRQDDRGRRHGGHGADDGPGPDHSTTPVRNGGADGDNGDDHGRHRRGHDGPDNSGPSEDDLRKAREDRLDDLRDAREDRLDALRDAREESAKQDSSGPGSGGDDRRDSDDDRDGDSSGHGSGD
jgi:hypothetical protein